MSNAVKPVTDLIDDLHTSEEEKLGMKKELLKLENELTGKVIDYERELMKSKSDIIKAEATGHSWLQRNWRPITMLTFLVLVVCDSFGLLTFRLAEGARTLLQVGHGGYVVGRSAEKLGPSIVTAIKERGKGQPGQTS